MDIKEILERIALPARSNKKGYKNTEKLEAIESLLKENESEYTVIYKSPHAWIFGKKEPRQGCSSLLVSSHADIVDSVTKPFSEYVEDEKYYKGTYDNLGTNAACVNLMLNAKLPSGVFFAFTADEETGRCNGAKDALTYIIDKTSKCPFVFALDVTDEGYENDRLFTVEGLNGRNEERRKKLLQMFMSTEGDEQSFEVVRLKKSDDNSFLPEEYQSKETTVFDESVFYAKKGCDSCSICLPGDGYMHSDSGFYVKEPVMKGYNLALEGCILTLTAKTQEHDRIEEIKKEKDELVKQTKEISFHKFATQSYGSCYSGYSGYGGGMGTYWQRKRLVEEQIPGQMSLADIDEDFANYALENEEYDEYDSWLYRDRNDPFLLDELFSELYEAAEMYDTDQFDVYFEDMIAYYGLVRDDELEEYLGVVFDDAHTEYDEYYYE